MKCSCGKKCDLLDTRLIVDMIVKEYYCLSCSKSTFLSKDKLGHHYMKDRSGNIIEEWKIGNGI